MNTEENGPVFMKDINMSTDRSEMHQAMTG